MLLTPFLLEFSSWHWPGDFDFADQRLRDAWDAMRPPTTGEAFEQGFLTLLRSGDAVAEGIGLDFYDRAEMTERYVGGNVLERHAEEVFAVARRALARPPRPGDEHAFEGADHASALGALARGGLEPEDAAAIAAVLDRMPEEALRQEAVAAAELLLDAEDPEAGGQAYGRLAALVARSEACAERVREIVKLREEPGDEAGAALVRATEDEEWRVRHEAAAALASGERFYAHRPLLERLAADWPPHERSAAAGRVREALAEGPHSLHWEAYEPETPELRAAHCELRTPTGADAHRQAFRALLGSGRPVAVGIALDHFHDADGLTRFGLDDGDDAPRVLAIARALLTQDDAARHEGTRDDDARQEVTRDDDARREAAWASALGIVQELGEPGDAPAIVAALHPGTPPAIITRAVRAASWCLYRWQSADAELIAALRRVNADETLTEDLRAEAAEALSDL